MEFGVITGSPARRRAACVVAGVFAGKKLSESAAILDKASKGQLGAALKASDMDGSIGKTLLLYKLPGVSADAVLLAGCGKPGDFNVHQFRKACSAAATILAAQQMRDAANYLTLETAGKIEPYWRLRHAVETTIDAAYRFIACKSKKDKRPALRKCLLAVASRGQRQSAELAIEEGSAIAKGVALAKELGNLPGNICTPSYLAQQARKLATQYTRVRTTILNEAEMKRLGMGALLGVSRGSRQPAKLIIMEYRGAPRSERPYALVGKGLTFDAGGISIKPSAAMDEMKFDMCGGASVFGAMTAVAEMGLPINLVGVVPSSENLPDGDANKPGDIVTTMSGQTVEILNTDAEGRLILCDALTYTERFKPQTVIDIATLTGACVIALGAHASGLFSNDEELAAELLTAAEESDDRAWRLPLWEDYQEQLKSNFADFANIGGREAGSITAACYLSRFTKKFRWAHLDVAGTAWKSGSDKSATGRPVSLLVQYLLNSI